MIPQQQRIFHTLDGLRGIAALFIVTRHAGPMSHYMSFPESFLAVDLFFLLSGFVIAYAYDERLTTGRFSGRFLGIRLIRLYPLYVLGMTFGLLQRIGSLISHSGKVNAHSLALDTVLGTFFLSSALDGPTWTLLPELAANMAYALLFRLLTRPVLSVIVAFGAAGVVACRLTYGTLDAGWNLHQLPLIASRLTFSFFGGVLLFKKIGERRERHTLKAFLCIVVTGVALAVTPQEHVRVVYEITLVLIVFPLVVWAACQNEPSESAGRICRFLGLISYAVYVLHQPTALLFTDVLTYGLHLDLRRPLVANAAFLAFIVLLICATWWTDKYYDAPVRKVLSRRMRLTRRLEQGV